ncbi:MAG TPA: hypothetical protein VF812_17495 [Ktedonobacterales bacterium]
MEITSRSRIHGAGGALIGAGALWAVAILIEYHFGLKPPGQGALYYFDQSMFFIAQIGYVTGIFGLIWAGAAGSGWFGRLSLGLFASGWIVLVVAEPLAWITRNNNLPLFPLGGLMAALGGLLSGIAVVAAHRWRGWQRYSVLIYATYYVCALLLPLFLVHQGPTLVTESLWGLAWLPTGAALVSQGREERMQTPAAVTMEHR